MKLKIENAIKSRQKSKMRQNADKKISFMRGCKFMCGCLYFVAFSIQHSQEGQNVFYFDVLKQIHQTIHFEKLPSDESESFTF